MAQKEIDLGRATISPRRPLVAGSHACVVFTYTTGHPIDDSGYLKIVFRYAGDFGLPQFDRPEDADYCTVATNGDCTLVPRWDPKGHTRPWGAALYVKITRGFLDRGEKVTVTFGDRSGGSPGWQVQSFCERTFEFKTWVDPIATYEFKELARSPCLRIVAGKPVRAVCIAPSEATVGKPFDVVVKSEDRWGNPTARPRRVRQPAVASAGVWRPRRVVDPVTGLKADGNPVSVVETPPACHRYWADFHGQSEETIGTNTIEDYFTFARDSARLDIAAHQGNDFQITDAFWAHVNRTTRQFFKEGRFVTFPGYEWSGNTPLGGDRNVYYRSEGGVISHSCRDLLPDKTPRPEDSPTAAELFRKLDGPDPFVFAHVGGRYADLRMHDPAIELAVEVHSAWGTFEWLVDEAFERGYRVGICANSDGHKGRPGASYPGARKFGSLGGLTCVLAGRLDRCHVYDAMKARHFYATTGNRPLLDVALSLSDGRRAVMGDVVPLNGADGVLRAMAAGTAPIDKAEVRNGTQVVQTLRPFTERDLGARIKIVWSGAEVKGRGRMTDWGGRLSVKGNRIQRFESINFWNPLQPVRRRSANRLEWDSITTGGVAGVILTLERPVGGRVELETAQGAVAFDVGAIGLDATTWGFGGLRKQVEAYRLPVRPSRRPFHVQWSLTGLRKGDNPLYIRVSQEDGHMAWSSPIYTE